jgi:undecaprenyl-diphosphatase
MSDPGSDLTSIERADRRFGVRAVFAFAAITIAAVPFGLLAIAVRDRDGVVPRLDHRVADGLHRFAVRHDGFTEAMRVISDIGGVMWWVVLTPLAFWLLACRRMRLAVFVAVTAFGGSLLNRAVKALVDRSRPVLAEPVQTAGGLSFPSGHTQAAVVGCGVLLAVAFPHLERGGRWRAGAVAGVLVVAIGFSRIALGVHFLSDVLGAIAIGGAWVLAMTVAFTAWRHDLIGAARGSTAGPAQSVTP